MTNKTEVIKRFFQLLQWFTTNENEYKAILHAAIEQTEYPNIMITETRHRTFKNLIEGAEAGKKMLSWQKFEPAHFFETTDAVIAEFTWTAELKVKVGGFKQGQVLKAHICTVFEFRDDKIFRQRNYDCYDHIA
jgi:ketosteroid isomerase-like protein